LRYLALAITLAFSSLTDSAADFRFVILGDRTGETQPGVFARVCADAGAEHPSFALSTGDSIQGLDDANLDPEWREFDRIRVALRAPAYLAPGNHDIWSAASEAAYRRHSGHPLRYSFDNEQAHFTVLDSGRSDELSAEDLAFLESDLKAHAAAAFKLVISHRPTWLIDVAGRNANAPLHRLAKQYGVRYVIAGHVHQLFRFDFDGVSYVSMPSAGGHLRAAKDYAAGWFFGYAVVDVSGGVGSLRFKELGAPFGEGRVTQESDWGMLGRR
jgi:3',5'-cyclic AMP phosphodiesterase CpdA